MSKVNNIAQESKNVPKIDVEENFQKDLSINSKEKLDENGVNWEQVYKNLVINSDKTILTNYV